MYMGHKDEQDTTPSSKKGYSPVEESGCLSLHRIRSVLSWLNKTLLQWRIITHK